MAIGLATGTSLGGLSGGAATARLLVWIGGDATSLSRALAGASGSLASFGSGASRLGGSLTRNVTLPIAAVSAGAIKLAMDFESALGRVEGLSPVLDQSGVSIDALGESLIKLSQEVGTSATDLADSFYFAGSAGLNFSQAMDVTELSAKGAAIGMGEAADISKVLIFALNAYPGGALTAASAMDTLTAAIREGTAEPEDMAIALGRLLPIAAEAGITFQEVAASVASLTNIGLPVRVATTSLRALFTELLAPTEKAKKNLDDLGISLQGLRAAIDQGPLFALKLLEDATDGNIEKLHAIVPQIRGFTALLGLTGERAAEVQRIFDAVKNSTGALDKAFGIISKTSAFQFQIALQELKAAGISLGRQLFPVFKSIIGILAGVGRAFEDLPGPVKTAVAALLTVAALAGPLLKLAGPLAAVRFAMLDLQTTAAGSLPKFKSLALGFGIMSIAAIAAVGGFSALAKGSSSLVTVLVTLVATFAAVKFAMAGLGAASAAGYLGIGRLASAASALGAAAGPIAATVAIAGTAVAWFAGSSARAAAKVREFNQALIDAGAEAIISADYINRVAGGNEKLAQSFTEVAQRADLMGVSITGGMGPALREILAMQTEIAESVPLWTGSLERGVKSINAAEFQPYLDVISEVAGSGQDLSEAFSDAGLRYQDFANAVRAVNPEMAEQLMTLEGLQETLQVLKPQFDAMTRLRLSGISAEESAMQSLADQYGVSVDFIAARLEEAGVAASSINATTVDAFEKAINAVEDGTGRMTAAYEELREAEAGIVKERGENLAQSIDFFGALPDALEASTGEMIANLQKQEAMYAQFATNTQTLLARGLDPQVLQHLVDQGPQMVAAFVNASDKELQTLESSFLNTLDRTDAVVLAEGDHLNYKGHKIISQFRDGMLANSELPVQASKAIILRVSNAFASGKLREKGVQAILDFANGLRDTTELPILEAGKIVNGFTSAMIAGDLRGAGMREVVEYANGIASQYGYTYTTAFDIAQALAAALGTPPTAAIGRAKGVEYSDGINSTRSAAEQAGINLGTGAQSGASGVSLYGTGLTTGLSFASGINAAIETAVASAVHLVQAAKAAADQAAMGSPKYFTYYMGEAVAQQFGEGLGKGFGGLKKIRVPLSTALRSVPLGSASNGSLTTGFRPPVNENHYHFHAADQLTIDRIASAVSERQAQRGAF